MLKVGLTGGIGSGKSEVSARLAELGAVVIDADRIAREVVEPGTPGLAAVVAEFGEEVLLPSGGLDREKVGRIVFGDPDRLAALNAIVHPLVGERMQELMDAAPDDAVVVYDVPLLVENDLAPMYDEVVVVDAPADVQLDRLVARRGMTEEDARARMANQASREDRRAVATHVIDNSGTLEALRSQVDNLWKALTSRGAETDGSL
ncbi:dephospho-CoA kinase [Actinomadura sp. 7K534]|uniref:dephospho-CoA kinase n=1 Tax=Actinomadura sp. 7K534 TaxID=2530366 RepID=UPI0010449A36|nr:dephospho-CoA kinase [Actinomadura sp. 7K534]TDB95843.1 dephospho-CoA kinase [Actinomadura sp. 7K534]